VSSTALIYTTVARARRKPAFAGISAELVSDFLADAERSVEKYCDRELNLIARTEVYNGNDAPAFYLRVAPVVSIASITVTDRNGDSEVLAADDYLFDPRNGKVQFGPDNSSSFGLWPRLPLQNISVVYTAGHDPIPDDIQEAVILYAIADYAQSSLFMNAGIRRQSVGSGATMERMSQDDLEKMLEKARDKLNPYRRLEA